eukprot:c4297_g1_i1.p1 GENE.c4297_g1_i1~~c4297_g1_i1.p1  ORF type:complete len:848 (+),score=175.33 c4297_g1_i1:383-2926(+)
MEGEDFADNNLLDDEAFLVMLEMADTWGDDPELFLHRLLPFTVQPEELWGQNHDTNNNTNNNYNLNNNLNSILHLHANTPAARRRRARLLHHNFLIQHASLNFQQAQSTFSRIMNHINSRRAPNAGSLYQSPFQSDEDTACSSSSGITHDLSKPDPIVPRYCDRELSFPTFSEEHLQAVPWDWNIDVIFYVFDELGAQNTAHVLRTRGVCRLWRITVSGWLAHTHKCFLRQARSSQLLTLGLHNVQEMQLDSCGLEDPSLTLLFTSLPCLNSLTITSPYNMRLEHLWTAVAHCSNISRLAVRGASDFNTTNNNLNTSSSFAMPLGYTAPPYIVNNTTVFNHNPITSTAVSWPSAHNVTPHLPLLSILHPSHNLSQIDLSNTPRFGFSGLVALASALQYCSNVTKLVLAHCSIYYPQHQQLQQQLQSQHHQISQPQSKPLTMLLCGRSRVTHLDLSFNTLGPEGAQDLLEALSQPQQPQQSAAYASTDLFQPCASLTHLDLTSTNYLVGMDAVRQLMRQIPHLASLAWLSVSGCGCDDTVTELLVSLSKNCLSDNKGFANSYCSSRLLYLNVASTMQNSTTVRHLGRALMHNSNLTELHAPNQRFGPLMMGDLRTLTEALAVNNSLTHLDLSGFVLGDSGVSLVAEGLKSNTALRSLNIAHNNLSDFGGCCLTDMLSHNSTLQIITMPTRINLCRSSHSALNPGVAVESLGLAELALLAGVLERDRTITTLNLSRRCSKQMFQRLSTSLHTNTTVTHLDLSFNHLFSEEDAAFMLALMLGENQGLQIVNLQGNTIWATAVRHICNAILTNPDLPIHTLDLQTNYLSDSCKSELLALINPHPTLTHILV